MKQVVQTASNGGAISLNQTQFEHRAVACRKCFVRPDAEAESWVMLGIYYHRGSSSALSELRTQRYAQSVSCVRLRSNVACFQCVVFPGIGPEAESNPVIHCNHPVRSLSAKNDPKPKTLRGRHVRTREPRKRRSGRLSAPVAGTPNNGRAAVRTVRE